LEEVRRAITQEEVRGKKEKGKSEEAAQFKLDLGDDLSRINEAAEIADRAYQLFRQMQTQEGMDGKAFTEAKQEVRRRLKALNEELNIYLAKEYSVDPNDAEAYQKWLKSHQPFHWLVEFYGLIIKDGFDVIIGNPPYLEQQQIHYSLRNFQTSETKAVHAMCIERSLSILSHQGGISMILPLSIVSTQRMKIIQELLEKGRNAWYANYSWRPAKLFDTVNRALTIFTVRIPAKTSIQRVFSTNYQKWISSSRDKLLDRISYLEVDTRRNLFWVPKITDPIESLLLTKTIKIRTKLENYLGSSDRGAKIYYRTDGGLYWKIFTDFPPKFSVNGKEGSSSREVTISLANKSFKLPLIAALSSDIFWWWYTVTSNMRHLNPYDINNFPVPNSVLSDEILTSLGSKYLVSISENSEMKVRNQKQTGIVETQSFRIYKSKSIIVEIDHILSRHYGFTDEELDFIINYDIKYRMGLDSLEDGDD
jgi:hypothetical protein